MSFVAVVARSSAVMLAGVIFVLSVTDASAQRRRDDQWGGWGNRVGGVSIDAEGVLAEPRVEVAELRRAMLDALEKIPGDLGEATEMRKISLKGLEVALEEFVRSGKKHLPDEINYLAGLQRIQYIFVYPEENDIVLAGPAEGWTVNDDGCVVGKTTGRPVIRLEDLICALRTAEAARREGISCSIDPTEEGRRAFQAYMAQQRRARRPFSPAIAAGIEKALGPQQISLTGIPTDSRFARVLVASDYRMKRIAMKLDPSPVAGLPSYLDLMRTIRGGAGNAMPRWWLACNYEPIAKGEDGLAWQLRGSGVKAMTEDEFVTASGGVEGTGRTSPIAQKWADAMTAKYDDLSTKDPVFGELRNLMDMSVVAALIAKERLFEKAGCSTPLLTDSKSKLRISSWNTPKTVASQCSAIKKSRTWIITASGGVQIESWQVAEKTQTDEQVEKLRTKAAAPADAKWRWN